MYRLIFELPRSGGVVSTANINTMRFLRYDERYVTKFDVFVSFRPPSIIVHFLDVVRLFQYRNFNIDYRI